VVTKRSSDVVVCPPLARTGSDWRAVLREGMRAHQHGDLVAAESSYREVLELYVAQPDALHYLGVLCHQRGRSDEGVRLILAALQITPRHPDAHNNLGNIHKECGRLADAEACYRRALQCGPQHYQALGNLGVVLEAQERPKEALVVYNQLVQEAPQLARGHYLLGLYLRDHAQAVEDLERAVECFRTAFACDDSAVHALAALSTSLYLLNRIDAAADVYREWLERDPDNPVPRHMLAACHGTAAPPRADDDYVREVFDRFADSFDQQLLQNLDYRAPQILAEALRVVLPPPDATLDVLDAGCGTGLCAPLLRPYARRLVGVDLSPGMVEKARQRGGYDELVVAELTAWLQAQRPAWDVLLSADTLVYFGELQPVLNAVCAALRPGGWAAFTLEAMVGDEDRTELASSGRYRHTRPYVERVLRQAGFVDVRIETDTLRKEFGSAVMGWVVLAQRPGAAMT